MVKNEPVKAMRSNIKSVVLEIEIFIENRESMITLISFTPIDLSIDYTDYLDFFLKTRSFIKPDVFL